MSDLLHHAQLAAQAGDWATVILCLQQRLGREQTIATDEMAQWRSLAIAVLTAGDFQDCWEVGKTFTKLGSEVVPLLIALLEDETAELEGRWFAARILGDLGDPIAIQTLVRLMQTTQDEDLAAISAEALASLGSVAVESLTTLLQQPENRYLAVQALAQIRRSETIDPLLQVVHDPDVVIRLTAIEALSSFHHPRVPPLLLQALNDPVAPVRRAAVAGLAVRPELADELQLVDRYTDCLWDLNLEVCRQAAIALGRLGTEAAITVLERALLSPNTPLSLQVEIVRALGWAESPPAIAVLQSALRHLAISEAAIAVRQEIVAVLGRCTTAVSRSLATDSLLLALADSSAVPQAAWFRQAIALALGHLRQSVAVDALLSLLNDADRGVRMHALAALKQLDSQVVSQRMTNVSISGDFADEVKQTLLNL